MNRFVLDASIALGWFIDAPISPYAVRVRRRLLRGSRAVVPALWHLEVANGLAMAERRGVLTADAVGRSLDLLEELLAHAVPTDADPFSLREILSSARAFALSAYDAVYLETARRAGIALATLDNRLRAAAAQAGVTLLR